MWVLWGIANNSVDKKKVNLLMMLENILEAKLDYLNIWISDL